MPIDLKPVKYFKLTSTLSQSTKTSLSFVSKNSRDHIVITLMKEEEMTWRGAVRIKHERSLQSRYCPVIIPRSCGSLGSRIITGLAGVRGPGLTTICLC